jgi:hypothetical protein
MLAAISRTKVPAEAVVDEEEPMKTLVLAVALSFASTAAFAQACSVQAGQKKLAGAAKASFLKKCCEAEGKSKKLAGAAFNSFVKKCTSG